MTNIAILASGSGSNAEAIAHYFSTHPSIKIKVILSNRADAFVHERAQKLGIPSYSFSNVEMRDGMAPLSLMHSLGIDLIVLAGYMCLITPPYLEAYPHRILNIHPALLPKFGGKGMYGHHVHDAVIASGAEESGITIHLVDEHYDHGKHLLQATCPVYPLDTAEILAQRIHTLEHRYYATTIEQFIITELHNLPKHSTSSPTS